MKTLPHDVEAILIDVYDLVKKIYEVGVNDGAGLADRAWRKKLSEAPEQEAKI